MAPALGPLHRAATCRNRTVVRRHGGREDGEGVAVTVGGGWGSTGCRRWWGRVRRGGVPRRAPPPSARVAIKEIDRRRVDDYIRLDRHRRKLIQMDKQRRKPRLASGIL